MAEERIRDLLALDPIELLAREYREWTGENMPRAMYVALREKTWPEGHPEETMFEYDLGVRIYKIPRYVELPDREHDYVECIYVARSSTGSSRSTRTSPSWLRPTPSTMTASAHSPPS